MAAHPLVVCVDDDADVARCVARSLRKEALRPLSTTEPEEALEWILDNEVAVLVSDFEMPSMNGVELAARVKKLRPSTVRILLTGHVTAETAMSGINEGGVFRFLPKPFDSRSFVAVVRDGIAHHRELAAVATEREQVQRRAQALSQLEQRYPTLTSPARAGDGAYLISRNSDAVAGYGLDALLALRRK
jgi:DNA-binding NtrC family response regulator